MLNKSLRQKIKAAENTDNKNKVLNAAQYQALRQQKNPRYKIGVKLPTEDSELGDSENIEIDKEHGNIVDLDEIEVMFYSDCKTIQ